MFSMCSELTPRARIPDTRIPQLMQPCLGPWKTIRLQVDRWLQETPRRKWWFFVTDTQTHTLHHNINIIILILTGQPPILALLTTRCNVFPVNPAVLIVLQTLLVDNPLWWGSWWWSIDDANAESVCLYVCEESLHFEKKNTSNQSY